MKPIRIWGCLGGHNDGQRPMGKFRIFNNHLGLTSLPKDFLLFDRIVSASLYWGIKSHIDHRVSTPCWSHLPLFHQGSSSAGSEPEPSFKPVLCLLTPKVPAPKQEK